MFLFFFNGEKITASDLANYIIERACFSKRPINNLKLQKILYYVQGHFIAHFGRPLFPDEIHAWKFGPAVPSVYHVFSRYGSDPLSPSKTTDMSIFSDDEINLINRIIDDKIQFSTNELSSKTQSESPWIKATSGGTNVYPNILIPQEYIKTHFRK